MDGLNVLQRLGQGHLIDEIHAAILAVSEEVVATQKPGSVTITLKITHPAKTDPLLVIVSEEVKKSPPKEDPKGAMFYAFEAELHTSDPRQPELTTFRVVDEGQGVELRTPVDAGEEIRKVE